MTERTAVDFGPHIRRLLSLVKDLESLSPDLWKRIDELRTVRTWPSWCFVPSEQIARLFVQLNTPPRDGAGSLLNVLTALCSWRLTRGLYSFDPDMFSAVCQTPIEEDLPTAPLLQLPEWCLYIMTPGFLFEDRDLQGFYVHLDCDSSSTPELRLLLDFGNGRLSSMLPLDLTHSTLSSGLRASRDRMVRMLGGVAKPADIEKLARSSSE